MAPKTCGSGASRVKVSVADGETIGQRFFPPLPSEWCSRCTDERGTDTARNHLVDRRPRISLAQTAQEKQAGCPGRHGRVACLDRDVARVMLARKFLPFAMPDSTAPNSRKPVQDVSSAPLDGAVSGAVSAGRDSAKAAGSQRLMSVDALRGFDMFWIVGAATVARALDRMGESAFLEGLAKQLRHPLWEGFTFFDLIFPLFIFIVGVSLVFSLSRTVATEGRDAALLRIARRSVLLFLIGIFYAGGFSRPIEEIRWPGVLQRIALCYFFAGILFCYFRPRALAGICVSLVVGYWALLTFVPLPGIGAPSYEEGKNLANVLDELLLPGRLYRETWDPEGILSTLPAIATCLLGVFAGLLLKNRPAGGVLGKLDGLGQYREGSVLIGGGVILLVAGYLWSIQFPLNKHIWTSSFVLVTGGYSAILLGLFHIVIDVWKRRSWCLPFVWIGTNAITIYLAHNLVSFRNIANRFAGGDVREYLNTQVAQGLGDLLIAAIVLALSFLLCWFLYRKRIFLRL